MFNPTLIVIEAFIRELRTMYERTYGTMEPGYPGVISFVAQLALENIATSDAAYHDVNHTIMVTLVGQEILRGRHISVGGVTPRDWLHFIISLLCHDIRAADIAQLAQIAGGYPSRQKFLTELTLDPPDATSGRAGPPRQDEDYTILSTIHSAKGGEWKAVRILSVVEGRIPSDMATATAEEIEEERRLLHVAMTRARDELDLIVPQRFFTYNQAQSGDRHVYASVSRFIPKSIHHYFDCQTWSDRSMSGDKAVRKLTGTIDVAGNVGRMWR